MYIMYVKVLYCMHNCEPSVFNSMHVARLLVSTATHIRYILLRLLVMHLTFEVQSLSVCTLRPGASFRFLFDKRSACKFVCIPVMCPCSSVLARAFAAIWAWPICCAYIVVAYFVMASFLHMCFGLHGHGPYSYCLLSYACLVMAPSLRSYFELAIHYGYDDAQRVTAQRFIKAGDALRLRCKLHMSVFSNETLSWVATGMHQIVRAEEPHDGSDPYAATRRAIVRAAAEIGRAMK